MIQSEMMVRMPAEEFFEWMALEGMAMEAPSDSAERAEAQTPQEMVEMIRGAKRNARRQRTQTPEEILAMFPITKPKR